jgi:iron complex outermembrane receptor protein
MLPVVRPHRAGVCPRVRPLSAVITLLCLSLPSLTPAHADDSGSGQKLEQITVTGSNIRRTDTETPSPVQVLTAEHIKKSGYTSVSEVLRNLSSNGQGTLSQGFNGAFAAGASGIALRGLTVGATLVLIDGHRTAPYPLSDDGQRSFVDISAIPFDAVERIEVLKDGASAIYGSDAIAGVVNVILKRSFEGTQVTAEGGGTQRGGGRNSHIAITHGFKDLISAGDAGYFSLEYRQQQPINLTQRSSLFTQRDYTSVGGINITPGVGNINSASPSSPTGYTLTPAGAYSRALGGCTATIQVPDGNGGFLTTPNCPYPGNVGVNQLQPDTHNLNLLGKFSHELGNSWTATLQASAFSSWAEQASNLQGTGAFGLSTVTAGPGIVSAPYPAAGPLSAIVPATGETLITNFNAIGPQHTVIDTQTYRLIADVSGEYGGWNVGFSGGFTKALTHSRSTGYVYLPGYQALLNQATAINANATQLAAILHDPANTGTLGPSALAVSSSELDFVNAHGDHELMQLPGGPLTLSLGAEYTHHQLNTHPAPGVADGFYYGANNSFAIGEQDLASAYFELDAQLLKNLELTAAGRIDDVNTYGTSTTPKLGIKYSPFDSLTLRGTYAKGFRAPNPAEAGQSGQSFYYAQVTDLQLCPGGGVAGDYSQQCAIVPPFLQQSNPKLQPETSRSFTLGLIFEPIRGHSLTVDYYRIEVDNQITSGINIPGFLDTALATNQVVRQPVPQAQPIVGGGSGTPTLGNIAYIPTPYLNANTVITNGIDIDLRSIFNLNEYGHLTSDLNASHIFSYQLTVAGKTVELAGTHGPSGISGDTGTPQTRVQWTLTWDKGPLELASTVNYISHYDVTDPTNVPLATCVGAITGNYNGSFNNNGTPAPGLCTVASFTTLDLYAAYQLDKSWKIHGSLNNAFDRLPPLDLQTYGGSNYNPSMHQAGAVGRLLTVGATYNF